MAGDRRDAVEHLYAVFTAVPRPERVPGCSHCVAPDEDRPLLDRPLRTLTPEALARYAAKALSTWGGVEEFRYFVPRLVECAADDEFGYPDPEIVFGKLAAAGWSGWPIAERAAIGRFLTAWWAETLDRFPAEPGVGTVLCCLGATGADLEPYLATWAGLTGEAAIRHLHAFVLHEVEWTCGPRPVDAFWDRRGEPLRQLIAWLTGGRAAAAVERAFAGETREDLLELLDQIHPALA